MVLNIHPMLVHFPIAFFISAFVFEAGYCVFKKAPLHHAALSVYGFAVCMTPLVVWSGLAQADQHHLNHPVLTAHKNFALFVLLASLISVPVLWGLHKRFKRMFQFAFLIFTVVFVVGIVFTAYNGGRLVYEYGIGVE